MKYILYTVVVVSLTGCATYKPLAKHQQKKLKQSITELSPEEREKKYQENFNALIRRDFNNADIDNSKSISISEIQSVAKKNFESLDEDKNKKLNVTDGAFSYHKTLDANGDQNISQKEYTNSLLKNFKTIDIDKNRQITFDEFKKNILSKLRKKAK